MLDSDGGSVLGTIALGRIIRRLDMITTIGKTTPLPPTAQGERRATLRPRPIANPCAPSCCSPARAATCRRRRRCWSTRSGSARSARRRSNSSYSAEELNIVQRDIGRLAQYTIEMGGGDRAAGDRLAGSAMGAAVSRSPPKRSSACGSIRSMRCSTRRRRDVLDPAGGTLATVGHRGSCAAIELDAWFGRNRPRCCRSLAALPQQPRTPRARSAILLRSLGERDFTPPPRHSAAWPRSGRSRPPPRRR